MVQERPAPAPGAAAPFSFLRSDIVPGARPAPAAPPEEGGRDEHAKQPPPRVHNAQLTARVKACSHWREAAELFYAYSDLFNHINVSALVCHLPRLLPPPAGLAPGARADLQHLLADLQLVAEQELVNFRPRELANVAYGFARLRCCDRRLMQLLLARSDPRAFNDQELSNLAWACATLQHQPPDGWLRELVSESGARMGRLKPQESCNLAWALVKLGARPPDAWLRGFCAALEAAMPRCCGQDVSSALWVLATLRQEPPEGLLAAALGRLAELLEQQQQGQQQQGQQQQQQRAVDLQQLSNTLWALSRWQRPAPERLHALALRQLERQLRRAPAAGGPAAGPNTVIALVALVKLQQPPAPEQAHALLPLLQPHLAQLGPQDCSNLLWALARLRVLPPAAWMQQLLAAAEGQLQQAKPQEISNLLWALAELHYRPSYSWLSQALAATQARISSFGSQHIANVLLALAKLRHEPPPGWALLVLRSFVGGLEDRIVRPQELANVAWALPLLGVGARVAQESSRLAEATAAALGPAAAAAAAAAAAGRAAPAARRGEAQAPLPQPQLAGADGEARELVLLLAEACRARFRELSAAELVQVAVGLSRMRVHPGAAWCAQFEDAWGGASGGASKQEAQRVRAALGRLAAIEGCDAIGSDDACLVVVPSYVRGHPGWVFRRDELQDADAGA